MIKFLRGDTEQCSCTLDSGVVITFEAKVVSSATQSRLMDLSRRAFNNEGKQKYIEYQLTVCVENLMVGSLSVDSKQLAEMADFSDPGTVDVLHAISTKLDSVIFQSLEDTEKKSELLPKQQKKADHV